MKTKAYVRQQAYRVLVEENERKMNALCKCGHKRARHAVLEPHGCGFGRWDGTTNEPCACRAFEERA